MRPKVLVLVWVVMAAALAAVSAQAPLVHVETAWVRQPAPSRDVSAAYLVIVNDGDSPVKIVGAASSKAKTVEMHEMAMENRMMRMRRIDDITVPAHGRVALEPSGMHLMLFGLPTPLEAGVVIPLTLTLDSGATIAVDAPVRAPGTN
ncbi:MAG: copper chaperone PCu(A)C [Vicinamibacterales bacterium]